LAVAGSVVEVSFRALSPRDALALAAVGVPELFAFSACNKFSWAFLEIAKLALAIVLVPFESGVVEAIKLLLISIRSVGSVITFTEALVDVPGVGELTVLVEELAFYGSKVPILAWWAGLGYG
jgi:hypothetical protein